MPLSPDDLLAALTATGRCGTILHVRRIPERTARTAGLPGWVTPPLRAALAREGITALWSHQRTAADLIHAGRNVVLATGTASGKSLGYLLPLLSALAAGPGHGGHGGLRERPAEPTALYLAPAKALAADQLARIRRYDIPGVRAATYDGDAGAEERAWVRRHANFVLSNPDMLHRSLLPQHARWAPFWRGLAYLVVDESHTCKGVFGSHVAAVLRRARRIAAHYGADPVFTFTSATSARAAAHCEALLGLPVTQVDDDGSPRAAATFALADPGPGDGTLAVAGRMLAHLVRAGAGSILFARSRAGSEVAAARAGSELEQIAPGLTGRVAAYRGGYLPEDRRDLENALRSGELLGVAATSALELGIDISGLDAVVLAGWPGSRASLWQRAGRAGRRGQESLTILLAGEDPLDRYLVHHPEAVFGAGAEVALTDPGNPHVLGPHLAAAAYERPLRAADAEFFGPSATALATRLTEAGLLRRRQDGWYWTRPEQPAAAIPLRGTGGIVRIVERDTGRVIGTADEDRAHAALHDGAVHLHQGRSYVVTGLDLGTGTATVVPGDPGWSTVARTASTFDLGATSRTRPGREGVTLCSGEVTVRTQVVSFERRLPGGSLLGTHPLDLPERTLATKAVWWTIAPEALARAGISPERIPGSAHAAEHAAIALMPLVAPADRGDIAGVSTAFHPGTGAPTVMVYDTTPGGAGFAERGFEAAAQWLDGAAAAVRQCRCRSGCPGCVQSPACGSGNEPLDKDGAVVLLSLVVAALLAG